MKIELLDLGPVQIKTVKNGAVHREVRLPGDDISDLSPDIQAQINAHWTEERLAAYATPTLTLAQQKEQALSRLSEKRKHIEEGGITVSGMSLETDRSSHPMFIAARIAAKEDPDFTTPWKGLGTLDANTIIAAADAVLSHVRACFAREAVLAALIEESEDPLSVDISTGWP